MASRGGSNPQVDVDNVTICDRPVQAGAAVAADALRFGIVGLANTATCFVIVWLLRGPGQFPTWVASAAGYAVAVVQSYLLNRGWTFAGAMRSAPARQAGMFVAVNIACGILYAAVTTGMEMVVGLRAASLIALVPVSLVNFVACRQLVFARRASR